MRVSFAPKSLSFSFCFYCVLFFCVFDIFCAGRKTAAHPHALLSVLQWYQSVDFVRLSSIYISAFSPSAHAIFQDLDRGNIYYTFPS